MEIKDVIADTYGVTVCEDAEVNEQDMLFLTRYRNITRRLCGEAGVGLVSVFHVDDSEFNAFAASPPEGDLIVIHSGIRPILMDVGSTIAANQRHAWLGGTENRVMTAAFLYEFGSEFVFAHELNHIWNGHTRFLQARYGLNRLDEVHVAASTSQEEFEILQALEMDADAGAIGDLLTSIHFSDLAGLPVRRDWEDKYGKGATVLALGFLAAYSVFRSIDAELQLQDIEKTSHPPAQLRAGMTANVAGAAAAKLLNIEPQQGWELMGSAFLLGESAFWPENPDGSAVLNRLDGVFGKVSRARLAEHKKQWARILPELDLLKRGRNLASAENEA